MIPSAQERRRSLIACAIRFWRVFDRVSARILWGLTGLSFVLLAVVVGVEYGQG